ncbi:Z-ring formation inhibitor MciZ [Bacillus sp. DJP31]|uniref:Z-ring formation inhibitor MciZ n=1 Tax=Bacillus sp. DJP31 TaxID=3409789 RepID=UPI003BB58E79
MRIHLHQQGISMVGKAWEIRKKLQEYSQLYETVADWIADEKSTKKKKVNNIITFPIKKNK